MSLNGRLTASELSPIAGGVLAHDAAAAWNAMNVECRRRGVELRPNGSKSSYRTYAQQVELWELYTSGRGSLAAHPGTSNHGWGLAVDLATREMRAMLDQVGNPYGWSKATSDAQSEWWHIAWRTGSWRGPDPGPYGQTTPPPTPLPQGAKMADLVAVLKDNKAIELFVLDDKGTVWHAWQTAPNGGWAGAEAGKRNAAWYSLGAPGKP